MEQGKLRIIALPATISALVFDIDLTLYTSAPYVASLHTLIIRRLAQELGQDWQEAEKMVDTYREAYARDHAGHKPSLTHTLLQLGISFEQNVRWREELLQPERYLKRDPRLVQTLETLARHFSLSAVTNNPISIGSRTLRALGVERFFPIVIGLDTIGRPKPTMIPFRMVSQRLDVPLTEMVSIGDRFAIDIQLPVEHGMGGILVQGVEDVYRLPGVLLPDDVP